MTPDLLTLARAYMALPGFRWARGMLAVPAPGSDYTGWCCILSAGDDGAVYSWVDADGTVFYDTDGPFDTFADLVPDLTDAATGGVMLDLLGPGWLTYHRSDGVWEFHRHDERSHHGATLAEAVARVAVAVGRAS